MEKPWQLYNLLSKKRKRDAAITLSDQNGDPIIHDPNLNALQLLNLFFPDDDHSVNSSHHQSQRKEVEELLQRLSDNSEIPDVSSNEVLAAMRSSQPFSSTPDSTPAALFQWCLNFIASYLAQMFRACIKLAYFPLAWKEGALLTIPKNSSGIKSIAMTNYGVPATHFTTIFNRAILPKLLYTYGLPIWSSVLNSTSTF